MIVDTCFLIDLLRNDVAAVTKAKELRERGIPVKTTCITIFELWRGFETASLANRQNTLDILSKIQAYPVDESSARLAGRIAGVLRHQGQHIEPEDSLIAGISADRKEALLTRNKNHFSRIPGLLIEPY